ncbi:MAG TPA: MogA/MoaB family molybdenum cofactor biosynthesis protein [Phycisphaerae bacterium]|nr:MogA/MoaB family molybdenum cofactor biosynthesis protein [Phycisphaerae bacterium]
MPAPVHHGRVVAGVRCAVLTVSDTRTEADDRGGQTIQERLAGAGHVVHDYAVVRDEPERIAERVRSWRDDAACDAVLITGGTGIAVRDTTYEAVAGLLDKRLDGFGELFRMLSYADIGPGAMLSRAVAGLAGRTAVFVMPGSPKAVELAMDRLIVPELGHVVWLARQ